MYDIVYPLLSAAGFAISSVMMKRLTEFESSISLNLYRVIVGAVLFLIHLLIIDELSDLMNIGLIITGLLILSVIFNVVLGDTSFFTSQEIIGVKIATPIVNTYPVFTIILAYFLLDEKITAMYLLGTVIIITGIILLSQGEDENGQVHQKRLLGYFLALIAILLYAGGVLVTTIASANISPVVANSVRLPAAVILLTPMSFAQKNNHNKYTPKNKYFIVMMIITGILGTYFSSLFLVISTQKLGAGMTSVLTSLGPLFALPLAFAWLKEKITTHIILGTLLTIIGLLIVLLL